MPQDISSDPRILMVEYALKELKDLTINKRYKLPASKEKTLEGINMMNSAIKTIRYSYIAPRDLVDDKIVRELDLMAKQFWDATLKHLPELEKNRLSYTQLEFIFNILRGFRKRLSWGNEVSIDKAIDIIAVRIITITKHDNALYLCRVGDGEKILNIITNLTDIRKDTVVAAAKLPPREFGSEISEAMFCSSQDLPSMHGHVGEQILRLPETQLKEVSHHIMGILKEV
jgi:predicted RNA-binding protein with EMAP domain